MSKSPTSSDYDVHTGFWLNHAQGLVHGATLTLDRRSGAVLIAFLALYVGLAGTGCWYIVRFLLHRSFSSDVGGDGIYHQRQAILRNSGTGHSAAWEFFNVVIAWRGRKGGRKVVRILPVMGISICVSLAFAAAGILSSHVTSASVNEVLLSGTACGLEKPIYDSSSFSQAQDAMYRAKKYTEYLTYALQCYQGDQRSEKCRTYKQPILPYSVNQTAPCPFDAALCKEETYNLVMDTGYLESAEHLGINGGPEFRLRQLRQCAPLVTEGFKQNNTDYDTGSDFVQYFYQAAENSTGLKPDMRNISVTFQVPVYDINKSGALSASDHMTLTTYKYGVLTRRPIDNDTHYLPAVKNTNAQISLIFLDASGILYTSAVPDPWFSANTPLNEFFTADEPASVVACATETFVCTPSISGDMRCIDAYSRDGLGAALSTIWTNDDDRAGVHGALRFLSSQTLFSADMFYSFVGALTSQFSLQGRTGPVQGDFPGRTRWQDEMLYTFQGSLASLQAALVETATGSLLWDPPESEDPDQEDEVCMPKEACRAVCQRQMIQSPGHNSFSLLGILLILLLGGLFIVLGFGVEYVAAVWDWISSIRRHGPSNNSYAQAEWQATSPLQLQRLAHEALGTGTWTRADGAVPVTASGDVLGVLDIRNTKHPRLMHPSSFSGMEKTRQGDDIGKQATVTTTEQEPSDHDSFLPRHGGAGDGIEKVGYKV